MSKRRRYTLMEVLEDVFVDENSDSDPDVADSLSYSSQQVRETGRQDSLEIPDSSQTPFGAEDTIVTPPISFLRLSPIAER